MNSSIFEASVVLGKGTLFEVSSVAWRGHLKRLTLRPGPNLVNRAAVGVCEYRRPSTALRCNGVGHLPQRPCADSPALYSPRDTCPRWTAYRNAGEGDY